MVLSVDILNCLPLDANSEEYVCTHCGNIGALFATFRLEYDDIGEHRIECMYCDDTTQIILGKNQAIYFLVEEIERLTEEREKLIEEYEEKLSAKDVRTN